MAGVLLAGGACAIWTHPAHSQSAQPEEVTITNVRPEISDAPCEDPEDLACSANGEGAGPGPGNGPSGQGDGGDTGEGGEGE